VTLVPARVDLTGQQPVITLTAGPMANSVVRFTTRPHQQ
jgi:hypothetical protein